MSGVGDDPCVSEKPATCYLIATSSQGIRWNVDPHKNEPRAEYALGVLQVVASTCTLSGRRGVSGDGLPPGDRAH